MSSARVAVALLAILLGGAWWRATSTSTTALPHAAFRGQTPDVVHFGAGDAIPAELAARADAARRARLQANQSVTCETCSALIATV